LGFHLLVQKVVLFQQGFVRAYAIQSGYRRHEQKNDSQRPAGIEQEPAPVQAPSEHALTMHGASGKVFDRKRKVGLIGFDSIDLGLPKEECLHPRLS
jgi:hypothetical protein